MAGTKATFVADPIDSRTPQPTKRKKQILRLLLCSVCFAAGRIVRLLSDPGHESADRYLGVSTCESGGMRTRS